MVALHVKASLSGASMDRDYEIFQCLRDGSVMWCTRAPGLQNAKLKIEGLSRETGLEYFAMHLSTRDIIFAGDSLALISLRNTNRIFQIAYNEQLRLTRAELLRSLGYSPISVIGNEAAKFLLTTLRRDDLNIGLFMVGHAAPAHTRQEMVDWLKVNFPRPRILALNPPSQDLKDVDYNILQSGPEAWIAIVASAMSSLHAS